MFRNIKLSTLNIEHSTQATSRYAQAIELRSDLEKEASTLIKQSSYNHRPDSKEEV